MVLTNRFKGSDFIFSTINGSPSTIIIPHNNLKFNEYGKKRKTKSAYKLLLAENNIFCKYCKIFGVKDPLK